MTQVPFLRGVFSDANPDWERSVPHNLMPFAIDTGISSGYLRSTYGVTAAGNGPGSDNGATIWNGQHYRVMGDRIVIVAPSGNVTDVAQVEDGASAFAQSFDRLAIAINGNLYYLQGDAIQQVTDPDLGTVIDLIWIDGYFMTTDGTSLVVTELTDPTSVDPLKYGSSEADPDPITGLLTIRGEVYAINRFTIEVFINAGTTDFPFQRQRGAQIDKGCVSASAKCLFRDSFAFVGSGRGPEGRGETIRVYVAGNGTAQAISSPELENEIAALSDAQIAAIKLENREMVGASELLVHLPGKTWIYNATASTAFEQPIWTTCGGDDGYRARNWLSFAGRWWCGDTRSGAIGVADKATALTFGDPAIYGFDTAMLYNAGAGGIVHELELVGQFGRGAEGFNHSISMRWTDDGLTYSTPRSISLGRFGRRAQRVVWEKLGQFDNWRGFSFTGRTSQAVSFSRLEAQIEGLSNWSAVANG